MRVDLAERLVFWAVTARRTRLHPAGERNQAEPEFCALAIARHTVSGVNGMSISVTPRGASASSTALTIAAGAAIAPASPQPFAPRGLCVHGWLSSNSDSMDGRSPARGSA